METKMVVNKISKKHYIAFLIIASFVLSNFTLAQRAPIGPALNLSSSKSVYVPGDTISVYANIVNINIGPAQVRLKYYMSNKTHTYAALIDVLEYQLNPGESKKVALYKDIKIDQNFTPDTYQVQAWLSSNGQKIASQTLEFIVKDTLKTMKVNIKTCKDAECRNVSKMFLQGERAYLNYQSDVSGLKVTGALMGQKLILPTSVVLNKPGTWNLVTIAYKKGYQKNIQTTPITVLKEAPRTMQKQFKILPRKQSLENALPMASVPTSKSILLANIKSLFANISSGLLDLFQ